MTFKAIETQEELDRIIQDRLNRQKETLEKQYAGHEQLEAQNKTLESTVAQLEKTISETGESAKHHDQTVAELTAKVAGYETASLKTKIALQSGLPFDLADRLVGTDEESLKADAERLAAFSKPAQTVPPLKTTETPLKSDDDADLKSMLKKLNERGE